jgi:hypothetical protein
VWLFPCKRDICWDRRRRATIAVVDPRQADAVMVGEGDAPVVAVLVPSAKKANVPAWRDILSPADRIEAELVECRWFADGYGGAEDD